MSRLKPCPFCDGIALTNRSTRPNEPKPWFAYCKKSCDIGPATEAHATEDEAIDVWNTRAAPTMREWNWVAFGNHTFVEKTFNVQVIWTGLEWRAYTGIGFSIGIGLGYATCELAKAACVANVKEKLRRWLV